jgi:hypothetical protein
MNISILTKLQDFIHEKNVENIIEDIVYSSFCNHINLPCGIQKYIKRVKNVLQNT